LGVVAYAFSICRLNGSAGQGARWRIAVGYGRRTRQEHHLWQDPQALYTTLLLGIEPSRGFFVGVDSVLHSPTCFGKSIGFRQEQVDVILNRGWHAWERDRRPQDERSVEVLVGVQPASFLSYVRFEREALGEDQGHRQLLAERMLSASSRAPSSLAGSVAHY